MQRGGINKRNTRTTKDVFGTCLWGKGGIFLEEKRSKKKFEKGFIKSGKGYDQGKRRFGKQRMGRQASSEHLTAFCN